MGFLGGLFGGKSEARQKAEMYEKLAETLGEKISKLEIEIENEETVLLSCHNSLITYPDSAEGLLMDSFETHEEIWKSKYEKIITNMKYGVQSLENLKNSARQLAADWKRVADMEDMKKNAGF